MRWLKKLLIILLLYDGIFYVLAVILNVLGFTIQSEVITGVSAASAVELIIGGIIKRSENADEKKHIETENKINNEENNEEDKNNNENYYEENNKEFHNNTHGE